MSDTVAAVTFERNDAYLRENYLQWLLFRSRGQRWLTLAAPVMIAFGAWVVVAEPEGGYGKLSAMLLVVFGAYELFVAPLIQYRHWRKVLLKGRQKLPGLKLEVNDGILLVGAGHDGETAEIQNIVRAWRGNLLYLNGSPSAHIYVPDRWMARAELQPFLDDWLRSKRQ